MSLIIKGIDLPKKSIKLEIYSDGTVWVDRGNDFKELDEKAIQIPKGHGRIIDENEAIRGWCEGCAFKGTEECGGCEDKEMSKYAPTILEGESKC